jgi:hypothetical protein
MAGRALLLAALLTATLAATSADRANACSCADTDPRDRVEAGEPALIGRVVSRTPEDTTFSYTRPRYTIRVERDLNVRLGEEVVVLGDDVSSCSFDWRVGERVGAFLHAGRGAGPPASAAWRSRTSSSAPCGPIRARSAVAGSRCSPAATSATRA